MSVLRGKITNQSKTGIECTVPCNEEIFIFNVFLFCLNFVLIYPYVFALLSSWIFLTLKNRGRIMFVIIIHPLIVAK